MPLREIETPRRCGIVLRAVQSRLFRVALRLMASGSTTLLLAATTPASDANAIMPSLAVVLRPETDSAQNVVSITVEQRIALPGSPRILSLVAPLRFANFVPVATAVERLEVNDAHGRVIMRSADSTGANRSTVRRWTTTRNVTGMVTITYTMPMTPFAQKGPPFGVKAAGRGLGGNSGSLLLLPELPDLAQSTIGWDLSRMVPGSRAVMAGGEGTITVKAPSDTLLDRWLLAGPLTPGQPVYRAGFNAYTLGTPPFDAQAMMSWSRDVYRVLAKAFGSLGEPPHLLLIRVLDAPSYATGTASAERHASLITLGSPTYVSGQSDAAVRTTIAHEMTHQWVGSFGDSASPWFAEGLTVYASVTLPCEAGLQPWSECAIEINKWAKAYYASEARDWSMQRIESTPFNREDVRRVPYGRGMMYFANLDVAIRARSGGRRTLWTALQPLFEKRWNGAPITKASWEGWLRREQGDAGIIQFRRTVLDGTVIIPITNAFNFNLIKEVTVWTENGRTTQGYMWRSNRNNTEDRLGLY